MSLIHFIKRLFSGRKSGYSLRGFWGQINHFNKDGVKIGYTVKGFWGGRKRYDMNGNLVSYTLKNFWGGYNTYDPDGNLIRRSRKNFFGGYNTYDRQGNKVQESYRSFWDGMNHYDVENPDRYETTVYERKNSVSSETSSVVHHPYGDYQSTVMESTSVSTMTSVKVKKAAEPKKNHPGTEQPAVKHSSVSTVKHTEDSKMKTEMEEHVGVQVESHIKSGALSGQQLDSSIEYQSIDEAIKETQVSSYVKLLIFKYKNLEEFPAIAYLQENMVCVYPLVRGAVAFKFPAAELETAKEVHVTDIDMGILDNEFYTLSMSPLGKEFEYLLPEYPFGNDGIYRTQYVFDCGMVITEKSMYELKKFRFI